MIRAVTFAFAVTVASALNNGLCVKPPMGYNTYMGHTDVMTIAKYFVSSGFRNSGYEFVNSDEGWEEKNRTADGKIVPTKTFAPDGMKALVSTIHGMGLKLGIYGAASGVTCGNMPGQLYFEDVDAQTYAEVRPSAARAGAAARAAAPAAAPAAAATAAEPPSPVGDRLPQVRQLRELRPGLLRPLRSYARR